MDRPLGMCYKQCMFVFCDTLGVHALSCSTSRDRISRQIDTRDLVFHAFRSAGWSPVLEAKGLSEFSRRRTGDIFIPNRVHGSPTAVDVTITCPLQSIVIYRAMGINRSRVHVQVGWRAEVG